MLVVTEFMTLDGVVQAPGGPEEDTSGAFTHGGWSAPYFDEEVTGAYFDRFISQSDALIFGRRTWQTMAAAWPSRAGDPFADRINDMPKYVASRTLTQEDLGWNNSRLLPPDHVVGAISALRDEPGGDLGMMGSSNLAHTLIDNDLVDEYRLMIHPLVLGGGKRLFPDDGKHRSLELIDVTPTSTGVQIHTYRTVREHASGS